MKKLVASVLKKAKTGFLRNDEGGLSSMIGLSMVTLCVAIGCAIDYGRVTNAQQRLAVSMDAAVLHVANLPNKTEAELKTLAYDSLMKNYGPNDYDVVSGFDLKAPTGKIQASANVRVKTWFMSIVGYKFMDIPIKAEAVRGGKNIEVALVLDNTGSMLDPAGGGKNRITVLKEAATDFVNKVIADPAEQTPYYSKAAIVPYSATVNPGSLLGVSRLPVLGSPTCGLAYGCPTWRATNSSGSTDYPMRNCVTERTGADVTNDADITVSRAGYNYNDTCVTATVRLLTDSKTDLKSTINGMDANGGTAGHIGIQWGIQMLAPGSGLSAAAGLPKAKPGSYTDDKIKKIMIVMTDGAFNRWHCNSLIDKSLNNSRGSCYQPAGNSFTQAKASCNFAKTKNIEIYFVGIGLNGSDTNIQQLTAACSTTASHVIMASDGAALKAAFETIAANIKALRLSL
jgi:Flp pilus assembly protein TadG